MSFDTPTPTKQGASLLSAPLVAAGLLFVGLTILSFSLGDASVERQSLDTSLRRLTKETEETRSAIKTAQLRAIQAQLAADRCKEALPPPPP
jgi:outer membrane murein-binding lipoprotein Lpp